MVTLCALGDEEAAAEQDSGNAASLTDIDAARLPWRIRDRDFSKHVCAGLPALRAVPSKRLGALCLLRQSRTGGF